MKPLNLPNSVSQAAYTLCGERTAISALQFYV